jgi:hypothetical protein
MVGHVAKVAKTFGQSRLPKLLASFATLRVGPDKAPVFANV